MEEIDGRISSVLLDSEAPTTFTEVVEQLLATILEAWGSFVAHLPYIIVGFLMILLTAGVAKLGRRLVYTITRKHAIRTSLKDVIARLLVITIWVLGILTAAVIMFPGLSPAKAIGGLGLLSVAIGFAFKDIFENFFAGILLLWRFPFETGDFIICEGIEGKVKRINLRMSEIRKTNGELIVVPNAFLFSNPVDVLTDQSFRRVTIMAGVSYDTNLDQALSVIDDAVKGCDTVLDEHPVQIFAHGFGESSIDIEVSWWALPTPLEHRRSRGEVVRAIKSALDREGIEIPFPYRTLTFKEPMTVVQKREGLENAESE